MELDIQATAWSKQVAQALLNVENRVRVGNGNRPCTLDNVWMDETALGQRRLMTMKVWTIRYAVNVEFILDCLLRYYSRSRRPHNNHVALGLPLALLTGPVARSVLEENVRRTYPARENYLDADQQARLQILGQCAMPKVDYIDDPDAMVDMYRQAVTQNQHQDAPVFRRPWRGNPF